MLKKSNDLEIKKSAINCGLVVLKNESFKQFFKHDVELYCKSISVILKNTNNLSDLLLIMDNKDIFNQKLFVKNENCNFFITNTMPVIFEIISKEKNEQLINLAVEIIQRCLFQNNTKLFEEYLNKLFNGEDTFVETIPTLFLQKLIEFYNDSFDIENVFKIITTAFFKNFKTHPTTVFKFVILILQSVGFQYSNIFNITISDNNLSHDTEKSLLIMAGIFEIIHFFAIDLNTKINETSIDDFVKYNLTVILKTKPKLTESILKILKTTILLNPLIIDNSITDIIYCIALRRDNNFIPIYSEFLLALFEMYFKLHRIHKFTSEMLRTFKNILLSNENNHEKFVVKICELISDEMLKYYQHCVLLQTGKQIISIMRSFLNHLEDIATNLTEHSKCK